ADLDRQVVDERLRVAGAALRHDARRVPRISLMNRKLADRLALLRVALEQPRSRPAFQYHRELPREIVRVLHARVAAETAVRRHDVRGVAGEENAPVLKARR